MSGWPKTHAKSYFKNQCLGTNVVKMIPDMGSENEIIQCYGGPNVSL